MTIGYGDVVPISLLARNLAILEGLTGQLYLVILISSLVAERSTKSYDS
jgi:voltage-gated potassium channel